MISDAVYLYKTGLYNVHLSSNVVFSADIVPWQVDDRSQFHHKLLQ